MRLSRVSPSPQADDDVNHAHPRAIMIPPSAALGTKRIASTSLADLSAERRQPNLLQEVLNPIAIGLGTPDPRMNLTIPARASSLKRLSP